MNDVEEQFWIIVIKREVPHVSSVILYKTILKRWNYSKVSLSSECSNWYQPFSYFIPHSYVLKKMTLTCALKFSQRSLWETSHMCEWNWSFDLPHVLSPGIVLEWMAVYISPLLTQDIIVKTFSVSSSLYEQSDENDSLSFCIRNHYWDSRV